MKKCICLVCGKEYETCNCSSDMRNSPWKAICDTSDHYQIYMILNDYAFGNIDKKAAKELLMKFDLSDYKNFKESAITLIDKILLEENNEKKKRATRKK